MTNWGDTANTIYNTSADILNIGHTFADNGSYTVTVTANTSRIRPTASRWIASRSR